MFITNNLIFADHLNGEVVVVTLFVLGFGIVDHVDLNLMKKKIKSGMGRNDLL